MDSFPPNQRRMDDGNQVSMVDTPDLDTAVFVRVLEDCTVEGRGIGEDERMEAVKGEVLIARWSGIKGLVVSGRAELV